MGIVFRAEEPYVIAVMTTQLPNLPVGRTFIRSVSRLAYDSLGRLAHWRRLAGVPGFKLGVSAPRYGTTNPDLAPDLQMWGAQGEAAPLLPGAGLPPAAPAPATQPESSGPGPYGQTLR